MAFNINPAPQTGSGAYGAVPGPLDMPDSIYSQLGANIPGAAPLGGKTAEFIGSELAGQIAPESMSLLQDQSAAAGFAGGQPMIGGAGSFSTNNWLRNLGIDQQNLRHQGAMDYLQFAPTIGNLQNDPNLAFTVAQQNALNRASPNPMQASAALMSSLNSGRQSSGGGLIPLAGGGGGGGGPSLREHFDAFGSGGVSNPPIMYGPAGGGGAPWQPTSQDYSKWADTYGVSSAPSPDSYISDNWGDFTDFMSQDFGGGQGDIGSTQGLDIPPNLGSYQPDPYAGIPSFSGGNTSLASPASDYTDWSWLGDY